jgi:hypothetical protein
MVFLRQGIDHVGAGDHLSHLGLFRRAQSAGGAQIEEGLRAQPDPLLGHQPGRGIVRGWRQAICCRNFL